MKYLLTLFMLVSIGFCQQADYPKLVKMNEKWFMILTLDQARNCGLNTARVEELTEVIAAKDSLIDTLKSRCVLLTQQVNTCEERIAVKEQVIEAQNKKEASYNDEVKRLKRKLTRNRIQKWAAVTATAILTYICLK